MRIGDNAGADPAHRMNHSFSPPASNNANYGEKMKAFMENHGGFELDSELKVTVPKDGEKINKVWKETKEKIAELLGDVYPPAGVESVDGQEGSWKWKNSVDTVDELYELAQTALPEFQSLLASAAAYGPAKVSYGPNDAYCLKSRAGLEDKVANRMKWSAEPVHFVNDTLRGTIIVDTIDGAKNVMTALNQTVKNLGMKIAYVNKFREDYDSGYVGIHACLHLKTPEGKEILTEVQIHLSSIENGSNDCPKHVSHKIYEQVRSTDFAAKELSVNRYNQATKAHFAYGMHQAIAGSKSS